MKFPFQKKQKTKQEGYLIEDPSGLDLREPPPAKMVEAYTAFIAQEIPGSPSLAEVRKDFEALSNWEKHQTLQRVFRMTQDFLKASNDGKSSE